MAISEEKKKVCIKHWIDEAVTRNETVPCTFAVTVPKYMSNIAGNETIKKVEDMFRRGHAESKQVDTIPGAYNLNRMWTETGPMDCAIHYQGVYPVQWNIEDVAEFARMENEGEIIVVVHQVIDGQYIPNH